MGKIKESSLWYNIVSAVGAHMHYQTWLFCGCSWLTSIIIFAFWVWACEERCLQDLLHQYLADCSSEVHRTSNIMNSSSKCTLALLYLLLLLISFSLFNLHANKIKMIKMQVNCSLDKHCKHEGHRCENERSNSQIQGPNPVQHCVLLVLRNLLLRIPSWDKKLCNYKHKRSRKT